MQLRPGKFSGLSPIVRRLLCQSEDLGVCLKERKHSNAQTCHDVGCRSVPRHVFGLGAVRKALHHPGRYRHRLAVAFAADGNLAGRSARSSDRQGSAREHDAGARQGHSRRSSAGRLQHRRARAWTELHQGEVSADRRIHRQGREGCGFRRRPGEAEIHEGHAPSSTAPNWQQRSTTSRSRRAARPIRPATARRLSKSR